MHAKIGISEADLACGVHWPSDGPTRDALKAAGEEPTPFRHNCSGKHTGMLAHALLRGFEKEDYLNPDHPVQVSIRETLAEMVDMAPDDMPLGRDGCSAPVYGIPLSHMALGMSPNWPTPSTWRRKGQKPAAGSVGCHDEPIPVMVAGTEDNLIRTLMTAAKGKLFCKGGAEGYQIIGVLPGVLGEGIARAGDRDQDF